MSEIIIYLVLGLISIINIVVPISGSSTVTPLLTLLTDPHAAIALASVFFFVGAIIRVCMFRKNIRVDYVKKMVFISAIAAAFGAFSIFTIPPTVLLWIVFAFTLYFLIKKLKEMLQATKEKITYDKKSRKLTVGFVGLFSGFLQGSGLAGSDLRNSYLYSEGLSLAEVHGTTAVMGALNFLIATVIRITLHQISFPAVGHWLIVFIPLLIMTTWIGKKVLLKTPKKYADIIVVMVMIAITLTLFWKLVLK